MRALAFWITAIVLVVLLWPRRRARCGDLAMFPYDNGLHDFGYRDWSCFLPKGHEGNHMGENPDWYPDPNYLAWRDALEVDTV